MVSETGLVLGDLELLLKAGQGKCLQQVPFGESQCAGGAAYVECSVASCQSHRAGGDFGHLLASKETQCVWFSMVMECR